MYGNSWAERLNGRQRAVHAAATVLGLLIASTMFFGSEATTATGAEFDCGPAAYALLAGPERQTAEHGDCETAARKRLTTVAGLIVLTVIGSQIGSRLCRTPRPLQPPRAVAHVPPGERPRGEQVIVGTAPRSRGHPHAD